MSMYYAVGNILAEDDELAARSGPAPVIGGLGADPGGWLGVRSFRAGALTPVELDVAMAPRWLGPTGDSTAFVPIGIGQPLTIRIHEVYPGRLPPKGFFGGTRGAIVSSAVKGWQVFDAQPRALNFVKQTSTQRAALPLPAATEQGTTLVFYSPAVPDRSLTATFEIAFDDVDQALFDGVSAVFGAAGGLPIFLSAAPYLLAAGSLFKLGGQVGNRLADSRAEFSATGTINLGLPGDPISRAGFVLVTASAIDEATLANLFIPETGRLVVKSTGQPYQGETPYMVISLDGTPDPSLAAFTPTAVSAALLERFYNVREGGSGDARMLIEALTLYNDVRYREEANRLKEFLPSVKDPTEKQKLEARLAALVANIQTPEFRPK